MRFADHLNFANLPTPIVPLTRCFAGQGYYRVYLKRDDFTGIELSGNKVRKLDFLIKDALNNQAGRIITCGGLQSNHCRASAFYATRLGLKVTLFLRGERPGFITGNYFLEQLLDTDTHFVTAAEYETVDDLMEQAAGRAVEKSYVIPEGGSNEVGAWGYIKCFQEIREQSEKMNLDIDTIVVATGSGGTHAGLLLGKKIMESRIEIISVNVCDDAGFFQNKIHHIMRSFCKRYDYHLQWSPEDIHVVDGYVGSGYGQVDSRVIGLVKRVARSEGLVLDPVYGAKAFLGFSDLLDKRKLPGRNVLFIHTGGIFGTFPYWEQFKGYAAEDVSGKM